MLNGAPLPVSDFYRFTRITDSPRAERKRQGANALSRSRTSPGPHIGGTTAVARRRS